MKDMPEEFWLSIRHMSSFKNLTDYNEYLTKKIKEWEEMKK